jgi:hypothetical protein
MRFPNEKALGNLTSPLSVKTARLSLPKWVMLNLCSANYDNAGKNKFDQFSLTFGSDNNIKRYSQTLMLRKCFLGICIHLFLF